MSILITGVCGSNGTVLANSLLKTVHKVAVVEPQHADPLSLVQYQKVLVSKAAIAKIEELLK